MVVNWLSGHRRCVRRADIDAIQRIGAELERRVELEDHVVGVQRGKELGGVALAERVVQGVVHRRRINPEAGSGIAVDLELELTRGIGLVACDVGELRTRLQLGEQLAGPVVQLILVHIGERELVLGLGQAARQVTMIETAVLDSECFQTTDGEIAIINPNSSRERWWTRFRHDPLRSGVAEAVLEHEQLAAQFGGDVLALGRMELLAEDLVQPPKKGRSFYWP